MLAVPRASGNRLVLLLVVAVALVIGCAGIATLPPDEHEILVLRTTHEMHARGDWVLPYFNDEPRLKKPPVSYWLTGMTAFADGANGAIVAWHGRVPSLLAGLAMTLMVVWAGRRFYAGRAAIYAAGLFVSSVGYFSYVHDARPDFLYAAACTAGLMAATSGLVLERGKRALPLYSMWFFYALASLIKGPQIPFMLMSGAGIFCLLQRPGGKLGIGAIRPLGGIALLALITVPWWLALRWRVAPGMVDGSQLAGRLLTPQIKYLFNGYYLYRPLQLLLPWVPLVIAAWLAAFRWRNERGEVTLFFGISIACVLLGLSFGGQQRYFYMLPVLPALCLLAGQGLAVLESRRPRAVLVLCWAQASIVISAIAWLFSSHGELSLFALALAAAAAATVLAARFVPTYSGALGAGTVLMVAVTFVHFADGPGLWSIDRYNRHELARRVAAVVDDEELLLSFNLTPVVYIYVTGRSIPEVKSPADVALVMRKHGRHDGYVLTLVKRQSELARHFRLKALALMPLGAADRAGLYRISALKP